MSFVKISDLPAATQANATDQLETNQSGTSRRVTVGQVASYVSGNLTDATVNGNVAITGTARRVTGDFSNATIANRVAFQTSTTNASTSLSVIPNGTNTQSDFFAFNSSDPNNASAMVLRVGTIEASVRSGALGTGTLLPMAFHTGGSERMRIDTSGRLGLGTSSPSTKMTIADPGEAGTRYLGNGLTSAGLFVGYNAAAYVFNDSNTPMIFGTNGAERMRIDASGNVGIGTSSPQAKLVASNSGAAGLEFFTNYPGGGVGTYIQSFNRSGGAYVSTAYDAADHAFRTSGTERMRIDASGNVSLGNTAGAARLRVSGGGVVSAPVLGNVTNYPVFISNTDTAYGLGIGTNFATGHVWLQAQRADGTAVPYNITLNEAGGNVGIGTSSATERLHVSGRVRAEVGSGSDEAVIAEVTGFSNSPGIALRRLGTNMGKIDADYFQGMRFYVTNGSGGAASERARITSGGEVYIAGTTDQGAFNLQVNGTGVWGAGAYVNGSDARIKDDIAPLTSGLDVVAKLKPVQFRYKESWAKDTALQPGFIAQDLQETLGDQPYVDGVVLQGPEYMSVAYQSLIPLLTKAIQELKADNDALKARVAALENN